MFLRRILNFFLVRGLAIVIGAVIYIYCAVEQARFLRSIQKAARAFTDFLEATLPDHWAVWLPALNLETSITFAVFIVTAYMVIDVVEKIVLLGARRVPKR